MTFGERSGELRQIASDKASGGGTQKIERWKRSGLRAAESFSSRVFRKDVANRGNSREKGAKRRRKKPVNVPGGCERTI